MPLGKVTTQWMVRCVRRGAVRVAGERWTRPEIRERQCRFVLLLVCFVDGKPHWVQFWETAEECYLRRAPRQRR